MTCLQDTTSITGKDFHLSYSSSPHCPSGHHWSREEHPWELSPWQRCFQGGELFNEDDATIILKVSDLPRSCTEETTVESGSWCGDGPEFEVIDTPGNLAHS